MKKHGRTENPLALASIFVTLRNYRKASHRGPEEILREVDGSPAMRRRSRIGEPIGPLESFTWGDRAEDFRDSLRGFINSGHLWPHKKRLPDEIVDSIIEDLINDVAPQMAGVREDLTTHGEMIAVLGEWA